MHLLPEDTPFDQWVHLIFNPPEAALLNDNGHWSWPEDYDPPYWDDEKYPVRTVEYMTRLFNNPTFLLDTYTPYQIDAGLYDIVSTGESGYILSLSKSSVSLPMRRAAISSMIGLYRDLWAPLYGNNLKAYDKHPDLPGRPQYACYMWWDVIGIWPEDPYPDANEVVASIFDLFEEGLKLDSEACLESILRGINHYKDFAEDRAIAIVDNFLERDGLSKDLREYATCVRDWYVQ